MKEYDNYLFDLYGTLVDVCTDEYSMSFWKKIAMYMAMQGAVYNPRALKKKFNELNLFMRKNYAKKCSKKQGRLITEEEIEIQLTDIFKNLYNEKGVNVSKRQLEDFATFFRVTSMKKLELFEDTIYVLKALKERGKNVYLLSNAQKLFTEPEVKYLGLDKELDDLFYSSDYGYKKPGKDFFNIPFEKYGLEKEKTVMIGNEIGSDIKGASNYGIDSYLISVEKIDENIHLPKGCTVIRNLKEIL